MAWADLDVGPEAAAVDMANPSIESCMRVSLLLMRSEGSMEVLGPERARSDGEAWGVEVERVGSEKSAKPSPLWSLRLSQLMTGALLFSGCAT